MDSRDPVASVFSVASETIGIEVADLGRPVAAVFSVASVSVGIEGVDSADVLGAG